MDYFKQQRQSFIEMGKVYFYTATINNWMQLLADDEPKQIIIDSLKYLSDLEKINVYGLVIMPNHIHLIWQTLELNGKETAQGSLMKHTAHAFKKYIKAAKPNELKLYEVEAANKNYEFWQRDSLAFELNNRTTALQKLNYIHQNPLAKHWRLADEPLAYAYSSAQFYENGKNDFGFLKNLMEVF